MSARFFVGVGAWLLGAAAATGGSLLAVSLLGQGIASAPGQQLTVAAVNRALAGEAAEGVRSSPAITPSAPSPRHTGARRSVPATPAAPIPQATSTVLTSVGGTLVARCEADRSYLMTWSPQQGFEVISVLRGPAATAQAKFGNEQRVVVMKVACTTGTPTVTTSIHHSSNDGPGHDE